MKEQANGWPKDVKRTKPRALVMQALEAAQQPLGAMDIFSEIEKTGETVWLSTVYRVLELLVEKGVADKIAVANSDTAVYALNRNPHRHYAVCMGCRRI
ncbi:MAG TPA: transcriptional repressor, partial [Feifaniaceae bacterium]|nr:transcriptional repressor [Feifaniaceae bacterium]